MARGSAGYSNQYKGVGTKFQDQYATAQKRAREGKDYRKKVRDAEVKELDEINGSLVVPPSGQSGFDNSVQNMAMGWKKSAGEAYTKFKNGELSAEEFSALKNDLKGRAGTFKAGSENLKKATAEFDQALQDGTISEATPDYIRDAYDSLRKGDGDFEMMTDEDGNDVLKGTTAGGEEVSLPINGLASGKNMLRWNQKVDLAPQKDKIVKDLDAFKKQIATASGVSEQTLGWDQLSSRASEKVNQILQNDSTLKSVAADEYGVAGDDPRWKSKAGIDEIRQEVSTGVLGDLENQLVPRQTRFQPTSTRQSARATAESQKKATSGRIQNSLHKSLDKYITGGQELDQAAVDQVFKEIGGNNIKGIEFKPKSGGFLGFGKSDATITITDGKGKKFDVPADPQSLINVALRTEFGTAVDESQNQIGGTVQQGPPVDAKSRAAELIKKHKG